MEIEQATDCTIHDMPENFEIREFLRGLRAEVGIAVKNFCVPL